MKNEIVLFTDGDVNIEVQINPEQETVWLTQKQMEVLFDVKHATVSEHISNILASGELDETSVHFFCSRLWRCGRTVFLAQTVCWHGNCIVGVHFGCCSVCGTWLCEVQRYDRRESNLCVDKIGVFNAEEAGVSFYQCVLRTDEVKH